MLGILTALLSGALMSIQGIFNTEATKASSLWVSTSFVQFSALVVCLIAWAFTGRESFGELFAMPHKWAAWRCDRGVYYGDGDQKHVGAGACQGGHADRGFSDPGGLYHRTPGLVWRRSSAF